MTPQGRAAKAAWEQHRAYGHDDEAWDAAAQAAVQAHIAAEPLDDLHITGRVAAQRDEARELLKQAADALWNCAKAALTVEPTLKVPYRDDPRWSPWTRWMERPAREAHDLAMKLRKHLRDAESQRAGLDAASEVTG